MRKESKDNRGGEKRTKDNVAYFTYRSGDGPRNCFAETGARAKLNIKSHEAIAGPCGVRSSTRPPCGSDLESRSVTHTAELNPSSPISAGKFFSLLWPLLHYTVSSDGDACRKWNIVSGRRLL